MKGLLIHAQAGSPGFPANFTARLGAKRDFKVWTYDLDNLDWRNSNEMFIWVQSIGPNLVSQILENAISQILAKWLILQMQFSV